MKENPSEADLQKRCSHPVGAAEDGTPYDTEEPVQYPNEAVVEMDCRITLRVIMQQLTGDNEKDIAWLRTAMERYKNHPRGSEIIKACARKLYDCLPEEKKKELDDVIGRDLDALESRLQKIRERISEKDLGEAERLMDELAAEADRNPMFREDKDSRFFRFREWFEECLYRHICRPEKEIRTAQYPYDEIYSLQGELYVELKEIRKARVCFEKALFWNPVSFQTAFERAKTFALEGNISRFYEELKKIQRFALHPGNVAYFLRNAGFCFSEAGKYKEAMMCYMRSLLFDRDSETAENEILFLHEKHHTEIVMPDKNTCRKFEETYGFPLGADNNLLSMMYAYGEHFMKTGTMDAAEYCYGVLYELTDDPEVKKILDSLSVEGKNPDPAIQAGSEKAGTGKKRRTDEQNRTC